MGFSGSLQNQWKKPSSCLIRGYTASRLKGLTPNSVTVSASEGRLRLKKGPSVKDCGLRLWLKEEALKSHGSMASSQNGREPCRDPAQHYPTFIQTKDNAGPYVMVTWVTVLTDVQMDSGWAHSAQSLYICNFRFDSKCSLLIITPGFCQDILFLNICSIKWLSLWCLFSKCMVLFASILGFCCENPQKSCKIVTYLFNLKKHWTRRIL